MEKFLYIDDNSSVVVMYPALSFRGAYPASDTTLELYFTPLAEIGKAPGKDNDIVTLTITANKHKETTTDLIEAINHSEEYLISIFDGDKGTKVSTHISGVARTGSSEP